MESPMLFKHQANLLRKIREDLGLTQSELAQKMGLQGHSGTAYVSLVEMGKSGVAPERWRRLKEHVSMEDALMAHIKDMSERWVREYECS